MLWCHAAIDAFGVIGVIDVNGVIGVMDVIGIIGVLDVIDVIDVGPKIGLKIIQNIN